MKNAAGVVATLIAEPDAVIQSLVNLFFRVQPPDGPMVEEPFGPEGIRHETEILDLVEGLKTSMVTKGFTEDNVSEH
jgi:hypothetical protein